MRAVLYPFEIRRFAYFVASPTEKVGEKLGLKYIHRTHHIPEVTDSFKSEGKVNTRFLPLSKVILIEFRTDAAAIPCVACAGIGVQQLPGLKVIPHCEAGRRAVSEGTISNASLEMVTGGQPCFQTLDSQIGSREGEFSLLK